MARFVVELFLPEQHVVTDAPAREHRLRAQQTVAVALEEGVDVVARDAAARRDREQLACDAEPIFRTHSRAMLARPLFEALYRFPLPSLHDPTTRYRNVGHCYANGRTLVRFHDSERAKFAVCARVLRK